jgi:hypothetical protein
MMIADKIRDTVCNLRSMTGNLDVGDNRLRVRCSSKLKLDGKEIGRVRFEETKGGEMQEDGRSSGDGY